MPHKAFLKKKSLLDRFKDNHGGHTGYIQSARAEHTWNNPLTRRKRTNKLNDWIKSFAGKRHVHKLARFNAQQAGRNESYEDVKLDCLRYADTLELPNGVCVKVNAMIRCPRKAAFVFRITGIYDAEPENPSKYVIRGFYPVYGLERKPSEEFDIPCNDVSDIEQWVKSNEKGTPMQNEAMSLKGFIENLTEKLTKQFDLDEDEVKNYLDSHTEEMQILLDDKDMSLKEKVLFVRSEITGEKDEGKKTEESRLTDKSWQIDVSFDLDGNQEVAHVITDASSEEEAKNNAISYVNSEYEGSENIIVKSAKPLPKHKSERLFNKQEMERIALSEGASVSPYLVDIAHKILIDEYGWKASTTEEVAEWLGDHKKAFEHAYGQALRSSDDDKANVRAGIEAVLDEEEDAVMRAEIAMMGEGKEMDNRSKVCRENATWVADQIKGLTEGLPVSLKELSVNTDPDDYYVKYEMTINGKPYEFYSGDDEFTIVDPTNHHEVNGGLSLAYAGNLDLIKFCDELTGGTDEAKDDLAGYKSYSFKSDTDDVQANKKEADKVLSEFAEDVKDNTTFEFKYDWYDKSYKVIDTETNSVFQTGKFLFKKFAENKLYLDDGAMDKPAGMRLQVWMAVCKQNEAKEPADEKLSYEKGHKNSKGEDAPWVIRSHKDNRVLASFPTKKQAEDQTQRMKQYSKSEARKPVGEVELANRLKKIDPEKGKYIIKAFHDIDGYWVWFPDRDSDTIETYGSGGARTLHEDTLSELIKAYKTQCRIIPQKSEEAKKPEESNEPEEIKNTRTKMDAAIGTPVDKLYPEDDGWKFIEKTVFHTADKDAHGVTKSYKKVVDGTTYILSVSYWFTDYLVDMYRLFPVPNESKMKNTEKKSEGFSLELIDTIHVPAWLWKAYLFNDTSDLEPDEIEIFNRFIETYKFNHLDDRSEDPYFSSYNDFDSLGGDVYNVDVYKRSDMPTEKKSESKTEAIKDFPNGTRYKFSFNFYSPKTANVAEQVAADKGIACNKEQTIITIAVAEPQDATRFADAIVSLATEDEHVKIERSDVDKAFNIAIKDGTDYQAEKESIDAQLFNYAVTIDWNESYKLLYVNGELTDVVDFLEAIK